MKESTLHPSKSSGDLMGCRLENMRHGRGTYSLSGVVDQKSVKEAALRLFLAACGNFTEFSLVREGLLQHGLSAALHDETDV